MKHRIAVVLLLALVGCKKKDAPKPAAEPVVAAPVVPAAPPAVTPPPATPPPTEPVEPTAGPAIVTAGLLIAEPGAVEVRVLELGKGVARRVTIDEQATMLAFLAAVGRDSKPGGGLRRCPDTLQVAFLESAGNDDTAVVVGVCNSGPITEATPLEGVQLSWLGGSKAGGLALADEPALRKLIVAALAAAPAK